MSRQGSCSIKSAELKSEHFADGLKVQPIACIPFDISVATAGNHGQMIADAAPKSAVVRNVINIAEITTGRKAATRGGKFDVVPVCGSVGRPIRLSGFTRPSPSGRID